MEVANTLAYYKMATTLIVKGFIIQAPGAYLVKLFEVNLLILHCKIDHYTIVKKISTSMKRFSLQNDTKFYYRVSIRSQSHKENYEQINCIYDISYVISKYF
jgi:hypothetical protein